MSVTFLEPLLAACPHCRLETAMEWQPLDGIRAFFCRSCSGFKISACDIAVLKETPGTGLLGRIVGFATGDRWLMPE